MHVLQVRCWHRAAPSRPRESGRCSFILPSERPHLRPRPPAPLCPPLLTLSLDLGPRFFRDKATDRPPKVEKAASPIHVCRCRRRMRSVTSGCNYRCRCGRWPGATPQLRSQDTYSMSWRVVHLLSEETSTVPDPMPPCTMQRRWNLKRRCFGLLITYG